MPMSTRASSRAPAERPRYIERPVPLVFPESAEVPETQLHLDLRLLLYQLLREFLGKEATVCAGQFVYFNGADPSVWLAPDVFVALCPFRELIRTWKVWERGAPQVAVEVTTEDDAPGVSWEEQLALYQQLGVQELIRFDPDAGERALRVWDRVDGWLSERVLTDGRASSLVLPLDWVVAPGDGMPRTLRIEQDGELIQTDREAYRAAVEARLDAEARQADAEARRADAEARRAAEQRVKELEAELRMKELEAEPGNERPSRRR